MHLVNKATGTLARQTTGMTILNFPGRIRKREAQEVAIMVAMDQFFFFLIIGCYGQDKGEKAYYHFSG